MQMFPFTTVDTTDGAAHVIEFGGREVSLVPPRRFDALAGRFERVAAGTRYRVGTHRLGGIEFVTVANTVSPPADKIDRDDAWHRRRELAGLLTHVLPCADAADLAPIRRDLPVSLLAPSGTWRRSRLAPRRRMSGIPSSRRPCGGSRPRSTCTPREQAPMTPATYARHGVDHDAYSHVAHFASIYAHEIALIERLLLHDYPSDVLTVADLGVGCGHFLLTLARVLTRHGCERRVRLIGIDVAEAPMGQAATALRDVPGVQATFLRLDVTWSDFADRLRQLRPDVVVANHLLEHLAGPVTERYLNDWLLAARRALCVSVPLGDDPRSSISEHLEVYTPASVMAMAQSMELRSGLAARCTDPLLAAESGLCL